MTPIDNLILLFVWIVFYLYWLIAALRAKRNLRTNRPSNIVRMLFIVVLIVLFYEMRGLREFAAIVTTNHVLNISGLVICVFGIALAIWARVYLGKNWGMPMSVKENPELVTMGPYRFIRHPIYSGILLAMLGSTLVSGLLWFIFFIFFGIYFIVSARVEDRLMMQQFPDQYPEYKKKTYAIIPFVY